MILINDIVGSFKRTTYGKAGDQVTKISTHGCVLIVEGKSGDRFPVTSEEVSEKLPTEEQKNRPAMITPAPAAAKSKKKESVPSKTTEPTGQQNLF